MILARWLSGLAMAAFVAVFLGYVDLHLYYSGALSFPAAYIFLGLLMVFAGARALHAVVTDRVRGEIIALYAAHGLVLLAWLAIIVVGFLCAFLPDAYWASGPQYLLFPIYDAMVVVFSMLLVVPRRHRDHFDRYLQCAFVVFLGSVFVDVYQPGTFSLVPDRAAGFAENPNTAAFVLVLLCCCLVDWETPRPWTPLVLGLTFLGVLWTLSRGGMIMFATIVVFYVARLIYLNRRRPRRLFMRGFGFVVVTILVGAVAVLVIERAAMFSMSFQPRLGMLQGTEQVVSADDDRILVLKLALDALYDSPVIGYGTGFTNALPDAPHNMYLQQWVNNGIAGLAAYVMMIGACAAVFRRRRFFRGQMFMLLVGIYGFFNHNILEERVFLMLLGVLLTTSFYRRDWVFERGLVPHVDTVRLPAESSRFAT
jgi:O-antigen ligase